MSTFTIWTICDGEPLPIDRDQPRLLRTAILSKLLADSNHDVVYWTSRFDHLLKVVRMEAPARVDSGQGYKIDCVEAFPYVSNVSLARLKHNRVVAADMEARMRADPRRPDVIVVDLPTLELAEMAGRLGQEWQVPVILSIRDLWPDVFFTLLPRFLKSFGPVFFAPFQAQAKRACQLATSIVGISPGYLDWGLVKAGRGRGVNDDIIPLGYPERSTVDASSAIQARARLGQVGVDFSRTLISFVGTFGRSYDLKTVISAAKAFTHNDNVQFVLCGDGERAAEWKAQARALHNVVFPGWLDRSEISILLENSTLGLAAYAADVKQGLPNKFFEYMSFGIPVVSSLGGEAATEITVHGFGCNYKAGDQANLIQVLEMLLSDPQLIKQMSNAGQKRFEGTYSQAMVYQRYVGLVECLAWRKIHGQTRLR